MTSRTLLASTGARLGAALATFGLIMMAGAGASQAQLKHAMTGTWQQNRGIQPIPIAAAGLVNGSGSVTLSGASPATIKIPASLFGGPYAAQVPLAQTSLIQLTTQFVLNGPIAAATLKKSAYLATRGAVTFAFCPGEGGNPGAGAAANPNCADHQSTGQGALAGQGTKHGIVKYSNIGGGKFGGTMQMTIGGVGSLSTVNASTPSKNTHQLIGGGVTVAAQAIGGGYNVLDLDVLAGGPVTTGGVIGTDGIIIPPGGNVVGTGPGASNLNRGFAWTTGTVYVHGTAAGYPQPPTTVTLVGSDGRNANGIGPITLVAGAVTSRLSEGTTYLSYDTVSMKIGAKVPTLSTLGYVIVAALMLGTAGFMMRRQEA